MKKFIFAGLLIVCANAHANTTADAGKGLLINQIPGLPPPPASTLSLRCDSKVIAQRCPVGYYAAGYTFKFNGRSPQPYHLICCYGG